MKIDKLIGKSLENMASQINVSDEKYDDMLHYIEERSRVKRNNTMFIILDRFGKLISGFKIKDFIEVLAFIMVLVFIPMGVKHLRNEGKNSSNIKPDVIYLMNHFISSTRPANGESIKLIEEPIVIKFNVDMNEKSLNSNNIEIIQQPSGENIADKFNYKYYSSSRELVIIPKDESNAKSNQESITVTLSRRICDVDGHYLPENFTFNLKSEEYSTGERSQISYYINSTKPVNGAKGISIDESVIIKFKVKMDASTLNRNNIGIRDSHDKDISNLLDPLISYDDTSNTLTMLLRPTADAQISVLNIYITLSTDIKDAKGYHLPYMYGFNYLISDKPIYEKDKGSEEQMETIVADDCVIKDGPGENYKDIGEVAKEKTIFITRSYNGWLLAETSDLGQFWISEKNVLLYDYSNVEIGIVTCEQVTVGNSYFVKGNLIWILKRDAEKSYVRPIYSDHATGYTGWVSNSDYTTDKTEVFYNEAFLRKGAKVYVEPSYDSKLSSDFENYTDGLVSIQRNSNNDWIFIMGTGGIDGWVKEEDLYLK